MTLAIFALMIVLIFLGMPVAFALGIAGSIGLYLMGGWGSLFGVLGTAPYRTVASYTLSAIPMFIMLAEVVSKGNMAEELFAAATKWLERLPGGLAHATILASAGMGALCGVSGAAAATMSKIAIPELVKHGYSRQLSAGVVAVSGTLAIMIPPSVPFILYAIITENSIGQLLIAGVVPGILTAAMYFTGILFWGKVNPGMLPKPANNYTWSERWHSLSTIWPFLLLVFVMIVFLYTGLATATEAAAAGAFFAVLLVLVLKRANVKGIVESAYSTIRTSTMMFAIIFCAMILGYFVTITQTTQHLIAYVGAAGLPNWTIMTAIVVLYLILGCILDTSAILFITLPLTYPLMMSLGYDPIWFGVIVVKTIEIGLITPPVGLNCYIVSGTANIPLTEVFHGTGRLLLFEIISLILLILFPVLSTWLPSTMI